MTHTFPGRFDGKVVAITGGVSGIGAAMARRYVAEGAKVLVADMCDEKKGEDFAAQFDGKVYFHKCDISDGAQATSVVTETIKQFGDLDIVHNNAAAVAAGPIPEMEYDQWRRVFSVGVDAPFHICKAAIPYMAKQTHKKTRGVIVNTSSSAGVIGDVGLGCYGAAKAAIANLSRAMAADHAGDNIRINCVAPGWTQTPMTTALERTPEVKALVAASTPRGQPGSPDELAAVMLFLTSEDAANVTGAG